MKARVAPEPPAVAGARWVPLTKGCFALIDEKDWPTVSRFPWCIDSSGYAINRSGRLHNFIMGTKWVDHINGNKLDDRRSNLRAATNSQNSLNRAKTKSNTSGFKGVAFDKWTGRWRAQIQIGGKSVWLGRHDTAERAGRAYDEAVVRTHGEFARPNSCNGAGS